MKSVLFENFYVVPYGTPKQEVCNFSSGFLFDDEKKIVDGWLANVKKFLKDDAGLTEEQCRADYNDLYSSGYMDYSKSSEYAQKYYNAKGGTQ